MDVHCYMLIEKKLLTKINVKVDETKVNCLTLNFPQDFNAHTNGLHVSKIHCG